ncbi:hypothetical protein BDS110ZK25_61580 [Bradyrhizobium diazoefficiens]|uniref:Uncharacterized protein n=3 Tax=Bradyrhizobium diazoefficiens TaxID=1355477 RepID=A0A809YI53_9BRAD|nr:signal transduction histidine kinase [Bradyrhizobium diazoefficiens]KGJ67323.1 hypothetical protein BJA5080_03943 [Bradyrhizobium diazoefficiens SEMIA 5080]BBZ92681.1 hypothetical protein F07S3_25140 [Bradyrhizobium diazoefficiens]BCA01803.1 hypothetical protein H12S4_27070 [Bradyrhizobium diazoefficiens]BCA10432.1 hypothetical protein BDHF08_22790 [Bradyrhizobium diazoefficiens]
MRLPSHSCCRSRNRSDEIGRGPLARQSRFEATDLSGCPRMEDLEDFIHLENLKILRRQIDLAKDDVRRQWLMIRLAEEEAKGRVATR